MAEETEEKENLDVLCMERGENEQAEGDALRFAGGNMVSAAQSIKDRIAAGNVASVTFHGHEDCGFVKWIDSVLQQIKNGKRLDELDLTDDMKELVNPFIGRDYSTLAELHQIHFDIQLQALRTLLDGTDVVPIPMVTPKSELHREEGPHVLVLRMPSNRSNKEMLTKLDTVRAQENEDPLVLGATYVLSASNPRQVATDLEIAFLALRPPIEQVLPFTSARDKDAMVAGIRDLKERIEFDAFKVHALGEQTQKIKSIFVEMNGNPLRRHT